MCRQYVHLWGVVGPVNEEYHFLREWSVREYILHTTPVTSCPRRQSGVRSSPGGRRRRGSPGESPDLQIWSLPWGPSWRAPPYAWGSPPTLWSHCTINSQALRPTACKDATISKLENIRTTMQDSIFLKTSPLKGHWRECVNHVFALHRRAQINTLTLFICSPKQFLIYKVWKKEEYHAPSSAAATTQK